MPFRAILTSFVDEQSPAIRGVIFCDRDGERIDAAGAPGADSYELDVAGASFAACASLIPVGAQMRTMLRDHVVWLSVVDEGYYVIVLCVHGHDGRVRARLRDVSYALKAHL